MPQAPTIGTATDGGTGTTVSVAFTAGATGGKAITGYTVTSSPGGLTGTGASSPITVSGLTTGTAYTFTVTATNANGTSNASAASNSVTPASPSSFESIATTTLSGGSVTFSSIPSTYKHLQIRLTGRYSAASSSASAYALQINGDTGANYAFHSLDGDGVGANANATTSFSGYMLLSYMPRNNALTNTYGAGIVDIIDYASTNKNKTIRSFGGVSLNGGSGEMVQLASGLWSSTSAINSISIVAYGNNWDGNTSVALYGIKGA